MIKDLVVQALERIAPLRLAEPWDNVGLILEAHRSRESRRILLTIDLTSLVVDEAIKQSASLIVSYHPPIFKPLTRLTLADPLQASLLRCASEGITIYSPHSALDSTHGGINDWLASALMNLQNEPALVQNIAEFPGDQELGGFGRQVLFEKPVQLRSVISRIKEHLELSSVQIASPGTGSEYVQSVAICAGSGGSVLKDTGADVYWTGEMSHHEVLSAVARGRHVILCGHTNTERGYLSLLKVRLQQELYSLDQPVDIIVSTSDKHPLQIV